MSENENYENSDGRQGRSSGWSSASGRSQNSRGGGWDRGDRRGSRDDRRDRRRGGWDRDDRGRNWRNDDRRGWDRGDRRGSRDDRRDGRRGWNREDRRDEHGRDWRNDRRRDHSNRHGERFDREEVRNRHEDAHTEAVKRLEIPESISGDALDAAARKQLRSLNKDNADRVARHLVYAGEMLEIDPETAYEHARAAYQSAARIDVVREALGLTAYATGRYSEALRELRTYRRMSDDYTHVPLEADSERGLGRPEKALRFIEGIPLQRLSAAGQIELALVTSGARAETDDSAGGLSVLEKIIVENLPQELAARVQLIKADRLGELGRTDEAEELRAIWGPIYEGNDGDIMVDLDDVLDDIEEPSTDSDADSSPNSDVLDEDVLDEDVLDEDVLDEDVLDEDVLDEDVLDEDLVEIIDVEHAETDGSDETPDAARAAGEGFVQDSFDFAGSLDKALEEDQDLDLNEAEGKE
ncbi:tetratricopeptide repeat protein [Trueperella pyogenes]